MKKLITNDKVDLFLERETIWLDEMILMRKIALDMHLVEEFKWGVPCYSFNKKNIILIHGFKNYCAFLFFKGALLPDPHKILVQQTENVRAARQIRFTSTREVKAMEALVKQYITEAINIETQGIKYNFNKNEDLEKVEELEIIFKEDPKFKKAFYKLTPGRQREYILFFGNAKQSKTRTSRITRNIEKIYEGHGLKD